MDEIYEHFIKFTTILIEAQKTLEIFGDHLRVNGSHISTLKASSPYADKDNRESISDVINGLNRDSNYTIGYFDEFINSFRAFTELLNEKNVKLEDRNELVEHVQLEIEKLNEEIHQIETITSSDKLKILQDERRDIEINLYLLAAYLRRYKNDEEKKKEIATKLIDSTYKMTEKLRQDYFERNGPVIVIGGLKHVMKMRFTELNVLLKSAAKNLVPRD